MILYHYACTHVANLLGEHATLMPAWQHHPTPEVLQIPMGRYLWLTDLSTPDRDILGLTSRYIACDRTTARYRILDLSTVVPWWQVARGFPPDLRVDLESAPGARPMHWFVTETPVQAVLT